METFTKKYLHLEEKILQSLKNNGIECRAKANSGLWLGTLVGLSAFLTILKEDNSYSEICLIVGLTGIGLVISSICLYIKLSTKMVTVRDFQVIYFLPAIVTSMLYLLIANKGLLVSVIWGLGAGSLGTWGVLQLMSMFPRCFTIGEATATMHGCILFLMSAVTNLPLRYHLPPIHDDDIVTVILQVAMLYVMAICLISSCLPMFQSTINFYIMTITLLLIVVLPVMHIILDQNPIVWMFYFIFNKTSKIILIGYWAVCLLLGVAVVAYQILLNNQATTSIRKMFHLLAVLVYVPGLIYEHILLYFASGVVMGLFLFLELLRYLRIPPLGEILQQGFSVFADEKDHLISLTPLYLFCGLSFPLWMPTSNLPLLVLLSGILSVGIGDTAASFVGYKWGTHKWRNSDKSIEGTIACILSQVGFICLLAFMGYIDSGWLLLRSLWSSVVLSLIEAQTNQVDNLALPLLMYACLMV
ncbi:dolichol kinase [Osmia bicornis bicornis]|uniref:dolichol kinase n=1 Tax=Osmia bicornis bicornis TaxID=1437191 RepID=UPI001EAEBEA9|nr:dolichol kinase [Osmia bicornis bicornis]